MSKITDPKLLEQLNAGTDIPRVEGGWKVGDATDLLHGVMQGLIDPVEGIVQLAEKSSGWKLAPQGVKDWARQYREKARSTMLGIGGEVVGNIAPAVLMPEISGPAWAGRFAPLVSRAATGGAFAEMQPVDSGQDYWRAKRNQAITGMAAGGAMPPVTGVASRVVSAPLAVLRMLTGQMPHGLHGLAAAARLPSAAWGTASGAANRASAPEDREPAAPAPTPAPAATTDRSMLVQRSGKGGRLDREDSDGSGQ